MHVMSDLMPINFRFMKSSKNVKTVYVEVTFYIIMLDNINDNVIFT